MSVHLDFCAKPHVESLIGDYIVCDDTNVLDQILVIKLATMHTVYQFRQASIHGFLL